jgi:4-amino-4-deoxy-L-arabinose transferase-like glycosyltransferase
VSNHPVNTSDLQPGKPADTKAFIFLILVALFAVLFNLGGRPIEAKDYVRYPEVGREILEYNDWVLLHLNGSLYVDKPPLHFWLIAGSYKLFGVNPFAARLPSALAALGGVLLTFFFVRRIFDNTETAFMAAIILLSTYDYMWWARRTRIDMIFALLFAASLLCFYCGCAADGGKRKAVWYLAFWFVTGLAFMDKAFIALANLVVVIPYSVLVARRTEGGRVSPGLFALTSPCLLLPVLPWVIALVDHPQFSAFWEVLQRTKIMDRQEAFYYYLVQMPLKLLPAAPFLAMGIWGYARYRKYLSHRHELDFAMLWIASYFAILHLTVAKSGRYLLPLYLPACLMSAWAIQFFLAKRNAIVAAIIRWGDRILLSVAALSIVSPLFVAWHYHVSLLPAVLYSLVLGVAMLLFRRFLPYKTAGLFVSFIILLLAIDVNDTVGREKASVYYQMNQILKNERLEATQIAFQGCSSRAQEALSFYFNRNIACSEKWSAIDSSPKIRAIVTTRNAIKEEIAREDIQNRGRIIYLDKGWVIYIKNFDQPPSSQVKNPGPENLAKKTRFAILE